MTVLKWIISSPSLLAFVVLALLGLLASPLIVTVVLIAFGIKLVTTAMPYIQAEWKKSKNVARFKVKMAYLLRNAKNYDVALFFYSIIQEEQSKKLVALINKRTDISAWYAPAAFWDEFGRIKAPKLMCVPDIVLKDFPVGFAQIGGNRFSDSYKKIEKAVLSVDYLVTYSEHIKLENIIKYYPKNPASIFVVPHAPNTLGQWLPVNSDDLATKKNSKELRNLLASALTKSLDPAYLQGASPDFSFLFYASQIRPNKNVMTLLRAYEYLLRHNYMPQKLIMTGNPHSLPAVARFIQEHQLQKDVLFLHGLSTAQLATCYAMADLAVNPSLSEGGCPFTFTEALSVGTPAIMARIPVALEVLHDETLKETTFFDPYDWKDMAKRILWALDNRETLLSIQKPVYEKLTQRTWQDVVNDHIGILEKIANQNADQTEDTLSESKSS
ncbi:MAG: glycosyltransferase [Alphaproteobacteria bacterium]|nr:glycosyltransferase [Alphaproteobacteria bacterium]